MPGSALIRTRCALTKGQFATGRASTCWAARPGATRGWDGMKPCLNAQIPWDAVNAERFGDLRRRAFRLCDEASRARSSRLGVACPKPARSDRSAMQYRPLRAMRRAVTYLPGARSRSPGREPGIPRPSWLQLRDVEGHQGCPGGDVDGPVVPLAEPGTPHWSRRGEVFSARPRSTRCSGSC